jgi:hypothetical protein
MEITKRATKYLSDGKKTEIMAQNKFDFPRNWITLSWLTEIPQVNKICINVRIEISNRLHYCFISFCVFLQNAVRYSVENAFRLISSDASIWTMASAADILSHSSGLWRRVDLLVVINILKKSSAPWKWSRYVPQVFRILSLNTEGSGFEASRYSS